jgi:hypothetical protein
MTAEFLAGLSIFKTLYDSAKALKDINDASVRNTAVIELQEKILAAREAQSTLLERIGDLEKQVASFETWETEKQRYELKALSHGAFAYALKPSMQGSEPPHQICANCYQHHKISILQKTPENTVRIELGIPTTYKCPECKSEIAITETF